MIPGTWPLLVVRSEFQMKLLSQEAKGVENTQGKKRDSSQYFNVCNVIREVTKEQTHLHVCWASTHDFMGVAA